MLHICTLEQHNPFFFASCEHSLKVVVNCEMMMLATRMFTMTTKHQYIIPANQLKKKDNYNNKVQQRQMLI